MTNRIELPGTIQLERTGHEPRARSQVQLPWVAVRALISAHPDKASLQTDLHREKEQLTTGALYIDMADQEIDQAAATLEFLARAQLKRPPK